MDISGVDPEALMNLYSIVFQDVTLFKDKTVLVIAHRMRTVAGADKIVVLADGTVAEQGTPSELLSKNGIFKRMSDLQMKGENWAV